jgi:hypothetical protein
MPAGLWPHAGSPSRFRTRSGIRESEHGDFSFIEPPIK